MATMTTEKRLRMSLLLDAYGELLTDKQRQFMHLYYEEDLSFGEIAAEFDVSRQAIYDSVKHGEDALEGFERALRLVEGGWARWMQAGWTTERLLTRLEAIGSGTAAVGALIDELRPPAADAADAETTPPPAGTRKAR